MRRLLTVAALALVAWRADAGTLQARLVRATGEAITDQRLADIEPSLKKRFGYEHYQQMGVQQTSLDGKDQQRLDLGEGFVVFVTPKSVEKSIREINLEWYSGRVALVKTTAKISGKNPLFIKGPEVGKDWIVLALTVRD